MEVIQFDWFFIAHSSCTLAVDYFIKHWLHLDEINHVRKQVPWSFMKYNQVSAKYLFKKPCFFKYALFIFFTGFYTKKKKKEKKPFATDGKW